VLDAVGGLLVVITGEAKAATVARILEGPRDERRLPAQRARRAGATWILDRSAASRLTG
jgi:6-phosphogluconolactonase/glucosamine-6-phosphate isomerase/deaminase